MIRQRGGAAILNRVRNVRFGQHQGFARHPDNAFVRPATGCGREMADGLVGNVDADHGKIAVFEFQNIRAAAQGGGYRTSGVRVGAESSFNHNQRSV